MKIVIRLVFVRWTAICDSLRYAHYRDEMEITDA